MKKIVLFGAGKRGSSAALKLKEKGIEIYGFCDSNKKGVFEMDWGGVVPIYSVKDIQNIRDKVIVVITIRDVSENAKIKEMMKQLGIETTTIEKVLFYGMDVVKGNRTYIAECHKSGMEKYYENAELDSHMSVFWDEQSVFYRMFTKLNLEKTVELACGHGRHVPWYLKKAKHIILVDILEENIQFCKKRFRDCKSLEYYVNNGYNLEEIRSESCTALFTYDAMVHFEMLDIFEYLKETYRILKNGGRALFHHSNNWRDYQATYSTGPSGRNYMSSELFAHLADRAGLKIMEQQVIGWDGFENLDCVTLVEK